MTEPPASRWSSSSEPVSVPKWITGTVRIEPGEEPRHVRLDEPAVVGRAERADPAIEDLEHLRTGRRLGVQVDRRRVDQATHQRIPGPVVPIHERLGLLVVSRRSPFDGIAGQGERGTREADQREIRAGGRPGSSGRPGST